jgi:hypothetical protein
MHLGSTTKGQAEIDVELMKSIRTDSGAIVGHFLKQF